MGGAAVAPAVGSVAELSDIVLLRRYCEERDDTAFAEIMRRYAGMVYAACFRVLQDRQLAEDAAQDTFLKLMRRPASVTVSVGGWLHKAATQLAIDVSRSESARRRRERTHTEEAQILLDEQKSWRELSEHIDLALLQVTDDARDLLVQHFIRGRSQKEIADERRVSVATICRRVSDALEQLRGVLRRRGMAMASVAFVGDFLALRGSEALSAALQEELGKMSLLAGVNRGWKMIKPGPRPGLNFWQVKELELAAVMIIGAMLVVLAILLMLGKGGGGEKSPQPTEMEHHASVSLQKGI